MACEHDILERECAVHDGACSLCAEAEIAQLKEFAAWVETWVSNPVGSYSVSALDGLFGLARDRLAKIAPAITEGK